MPAKVGEFKGRAVITVDGPNQFPRVTFGVSKAVLVLQHIEEIAKFVDDYGNAEQRESYTNFCKNWTPRKAPRPTPAQPAVTPAEATTAKKTRKSKAKPKPEDDPDFR